MYKIKTLLKLTRVFLLKETNVNLKIYNFNKLWLNSYTIIRTQISKIKSLEVTEINKKQMNYNKTKLSN